MWNILVVCLQKIQLFKCHWVERDNWNEQKIHLFLLAEDKVIFSSMENKKQSGERAFWGTALRVNRCRGLIKKTMQNNNSIYLCHWPHKASASQKPRAAKKAGWETLDRLWNETFPCRALSSPDAPGEAQLTLLPGLNKQPKEQTWPQIHLSCFKTLCCHICSVSK